MDELCQVVKTSAGFPTSNRFHESTAGSLCRRVHDERTRKDSVPQSPVNDALKPEHSSPLAARPGRGPHVPDLWNRNYWPLITANNFGSFAACPT